MMTLSFLFVVVLNSVVWYSNTILVRYVYEKAMCQYIYSRLSDGVWMWVMGWRR